MLGLSGGALGFSVSLLSGDEPFIGYWQSALFHFHAIAQLVSIAAGVSFTLNRVRDLDLTSQIVRVRTESPSAPRLRGMREKVRRWGRVSRRLYMLQGASFLFGAFGFVAFAGLTYSGALYPLAK